MNDLLQAPPRANMRYFPIPVLLALIGAVALTALSAAINIRHATATYERGIDAQLAGALVLAATIGFVILPAMSMSAFRVRRWAYGAIVAMAALLCGGVSLSNVIGASHGQRAATAFDASDTADKRKAAQQAITKAEAEILTLGSPRSSTVVDAEIASVFARTPGLDSCVPVPNWTLGRTQREACKTITALGIEKANAGRKAALEDDIREARLVLATEKASKTVGNGDTLAIVTAAKKLGRVADAETVDLLKSIGTALAAELFAAILFVAWELGGNVPTKNTVSQIPSLQAPVMFHVPAACNNLALAIPVNAQEIQALGSVTCGVTNTPQVLSISDDACDRLLGLLHERGGELIGGLRTFGKALGVSHTEVSRLLTDMSQAGRIEVQAGKRGTRVRLITIQPTTSVAKAPV